ncbi:PhoX family protein [Pseudobacteriovorax antillogorgiicola]|uniref:Phosphatase n=1 Tax=Pseudobacteriovorax antillogorgiicola TaxID=1513793 RepID=A0A1Y6CH76_9BACT|nr:PhoX family phosphatase [Pseudobacteriovorax antillogorgiicola]TCS47233.1 hypothetical protein EDD56_1216 [Pseudobacteriovorax antillogorgiicola]SMF61942.1 hypothetical protein SAMN06296036_1216 [Pseudobacteriovorax antillogorgiicola]
MTNQKFDASDDAVCNQSGNESFRTILARTFSRRTVVKGSLASAAGTFIASSAASSRSLASGQLGPDSKLLDFLPVSLAEGNGAIPTVSPDYDYQVFIPWGDPIEPSGPAYQWPPSAEDQRLQIGIGHDGMTYFPMSADSESFDRREIYRNAVNYGSKHGMLCINHEFGTNPHVLGKDAPESIDDVRASQHAHGVSVLEVKRYGRQWRLVNSKNARRVHVNTPVRFSGPAAKSDLLKTPNGNIPLGTVNNCSNGETPWGTYLTCEENFNGYFGASNRESQWTPSKEQERYGFSENGFGYGWHVYDRRFDLSDADFTNEENRFGWVVEIDPFDGTQVPVKRTALGRIKHEGATVVEAGDGRVVVYMGDDQRFDYIYKFVSKDPWRQMRSEGRDPLDDGTLYVARFNEDGSGVWLPLDMSVPVLAENFASQEEILVFTRLAADKVGATPMDRPEWIAVAPNQDVYCTLTNNSQRTEATGANPLAPNPDGHIIRWRDTEQHSGKKFVWEVFLISEETHGTEQSFADPDGIWIDPDGRLFIQTDGGQKDGLNNQMLVVDTRTKEIRRLLTGVTGDEVTGIAVTPDRRTMFVNLQHPGNGDPSVTNFPAPLDGVTVPRDCTLILTRKDGGIIGS